MNENLDSLVSTFCNFINYDDIKKKVGRHKSHLCPLTTTHSLQLLIYSTIKYIYII